MSHRTRRDPILPLRPLVIVLLACFAVGASPQPASPWATMAAPIFMRVDTKALPHPDVRTVAQDATGFLWIGTPGGLARFDGYNFRNFSPNPNDPNALPDGWIRSMRADPRGGLWIGTESSGLVHYNDATDTFRTWRADSEDRSGPRSTIVMALAQTPDGTLWIGGDQGLDRFDPSHGSFERIALAAPGAPEPTIDDILVDHAGAMWVGTLQALYYRPNASAPFRRFSLGERAGALLDIYCVYEDSAGRIWVGANDAAYVIDRDRTHTTQLTAAANDPDTLAIGRQISIIETTPGNMWIGSSAGDIASVDTSSWRVRRFAADRNNPGGLDVGPVQQFFRDRSGLIWVARGSGGLAFHNPRSRGFYVLSATRPELGMGEDGATSLDALPKNRLWIGRLLGNLTLLSPGQPPRILRLPNHSNAVTVFAEPDGSLWIGTLAGLCRLRASATQAECSAGPSIIGTSRVDDVLDDGKTLWIGTREGLVAQDDRTGRVRTYRGGRAMGTLTNRWVTALLRDRRGRLWVGTQNGLNRLDPGGRIVRFRFHPNDPNSFGTGVVASLLEDRDGRIWAGAIGGALNVLQEAANGKVTIRHLGRADGLPHENVDGLAQDASGRIWASTPEGIAAFDPRTLTARAYGLADGVSDGAYHAGSVSQAGGTMFFGGFDGITAIAPDATSPWSYAPPLVVTTLSIGRKGVTASSANDGDATFDLPSDARDVAVEFSALDYSAPQKLRYAYKLDGFDRDWVPADVEERTATYTNLPPGSYSLRIRGTNRLGVWSERALALHLIVRAAWYETWWFRALLVLLLLALGYLAHRVRTEVLRRQQHELELIVDRRTRELSAANAALQEMSLTDPLTGLRNRRFLMHNIEDDVSLSLRRYVEWRKSGQGDAPQDADLIFFMVDIDWFKKVNDEFGHSGGDRLLAQMRGRFEAVFRKSDYILRWGGEEFLAVARGSRRAEAPEIAERLREAVAREPFQLDSDLLLAKTISIGFAAYPFVISEPQAVSWFHVVDLADQALFMAKHGGRDTWYGLAASERTDPKTLVRSLVTFAEEAARVGMLEIVSHNAQARSVP